MDPAHLESQLQQFCIHAMLLSQANAMVGPLRLAKVVHSLCHLRRHPSLRTDLALSAWQRHNHWQASPFTEV